jgi:hypothetical protein
MDFFKKLQADREIDVKYWRKHPELRKQLVEDAYLNKAHFIYELLQNAEDAQATKAVFRLYDDRLEFQHDGRRQFTERDIDAITDVSKSGKTDADDTIGRFGIGFKSVFQYTDTPRIYSGIYAFIIRDFVYPEPIPTVTNLGNDTLFVFEFDRSSKPPSDALREITSGLTNLADTTLLFLSSLRTIQWQIQGQDTHEILRVLHSEHHLEIRATVGGMQTDGSHFLRFTAPVEGLPTRSLAVAFALDFQPTSSAYDPAKPISEYFRIVPADPGRVAVYFPADEERSGLRFHLHAPCVTVLSRASIKDSSANERLFDHLAKLVATSLHPVKELGLLTGEFLKVLPSPQDPIVPRYQRVRDAIIQEMRNQPLTPTHAKSHAPAKQLLQAKRPLKDLLSDDDLGQLRHISGKPPRWAISPGLQNSDQDRFLDGLGIERWDIDKFVEYLQHQNFQAWLKAKPVEWHQRMYALFCEEYVDNGSNGLLRPIHIDISLEQLKKLPIVRLSNGEYRTGGECYFPSDGIEDDPWLPRVDPRTYSSGTSKREQERAKELLKALGVREVGSAERVLSILKQRYTHDAEIPDDATYLSDLKLFMELVESEASQADRFSGYYIFMRASNDWHTPKWVFLDLPYRDTGLTAYFDHLLLSQSAKKQPLSEWYSRHSVSSEQLVKFARAVKVQTGLEPVRVSCKENPEWERLERESGERTRLENDEDYMIEYLDDLLRWPNIELSRLIWRTMCELDRKYLTACYQKNERNGPKIANSQLVHCLRNAEWVPQTEDEIRFKFVCPAEASRERLPKGFQVDRGYEWLKRVNFGEEEQQRSAESRQRRAIARELGFPDEEALSDGKWYANLPLEERRRIKDENERKQQFELPEHSPKNPDLRAERVAQEAAEAPERTTEKRMRSVSVGEEAVKQKARLYLKEQYTKDAEMFCQVCKTKTPLPFKLDDGSYYFEAVEFLPDSALKKRHRANYLALCPNHAAMYQHANGSSNEMKTLFLEMAGPELLVILAQEDATIYFTETHLVDLRTVIETEAAGQPV